MNIDSGGSGESAMPKAVVDIAGNVTVVWGSDDPPNARAWVNRFEGNLWKTAENIATVTTNNYIMPDIALLPDGKVIATWTDPVTNDAKYNLFTSADGWSDAVTIANADGIPDTIPQAAFDRAGNGLLVWTQNDTEVYACRFTLNTGCAESKLLGKSASVRIGMNGAGDAVVVWTEYPISGIANVWGAAFD